MDFETEIRQKTYGKIGSKLVYIYIPWLLFLSGLVIAIISINQEFNKKENVVNAIYFSPFIKDSTMLLQKVIFAKDSINMDIDTIAVDVSPKLTNYYINRKFNYELEQLKNKNLYTNKSYLNIKGIKIPYNLIIPYFSLLIVILGLALYPFLVYYGFSIINSAQIELKRNIENISTTLKDVAAWTYEPAMKVNINVSNMYDFFIHMPFVIARRYGYFDKELMTLETINKKTDKDAILALFEGNSIAITDPSFATIDKNPDLVLEDKINDLVFLSPLVINYPIWAIEKNNKESKEFKILTYGRNSTSFDVVFKYFKNSKINGKILNEKEIHKHVITIEQFVKDFVKKIINKELKSSILNSNKYSFLYKLLNDKIKNEEYTILFQLMVCIANHSDYEGTEIRNKLIDYFKSFDYYFLTDPEYSILKYVLEENYSEIPNDKLNINNNKIFTALITTKTNIVNNPVGITRFLKALKLGIYKLPAMMNAENKDKIFKSIIEDVSKHYNENLIITEGSKNIEFKIDENYYPDDLIIYLQEEDNYENLLNTLNLSRHAIKNNILKKKGNNYPSLDEKVDFILRRL